MAKRRFWLNTDSSEAKNTLALVGEKQWLSNTYKALKEISLIEKASNNFSLPVMTPFNQDAYNPALEKLLLSIQELAAKAEPYMNGDAEIVLRAVSAMNIVYDRAADTIENYTPQGVPAEFVGQFKGFMAQVSKPMRVKAAAQSRQISKLVQTGKLESPNSIVAAPHGQTLTKMGWSHPAAALALPMTIPHSPARRTASTKGER